MYRSIRGFVWCALLAALLSPPGMVAAQTEAAPTAAQRTEARAAYARAQAAFSAGDFAAAEEGFLAAFAAIPNPIVLVGLSEAQERQDKAVEAVATMERYLAMRADAPDRADMTARIARLRALPATLVVNSTPAGAAISIDGQDTGEVTPQEFEMAPGSHALVLSADGMVTTDRAVELTFATRTELSVTLEAPSAEALPLEVDGDAVELEEEPDSEDDDDEEGAGTAVWVTSGIAAAGLVAGTVLGFLALSQESEFDETPTMEIADDGERLAVFADVAFGIAAVSAITAVVLFLSAGDDDDEEDEEAGVTARILPVVGVGPGGVRSGGVSAQVEF